MPRKGLLERLAEGVVIGDGGFVTLMEKRGYARIGGWTPEATVAQVRPPGPRYSGRTSRYRPRLRLEQNP